MNVNMQVYFKLFLFRNKIIKMFVIQLLKPLQSFVNAHIPL